MKTKLKKTLWYITKQTMGEELFMTIFNVMKYFSEEEKYDPKKFKEYWIKLPNKDKEETKSKETTRNLIIAKFLGLLNLDETPTEIGCEFIANLDNQSVLHEIIEDCKINFRLNKEFSNKKDLDKNSFNKIEPFRIFHDFLLMAENDGLEVNELDYKYYVSYIPDYDSLKDHYESFKFDKLEKIDVKSKEDYKKYEKDIDNIRHNGLWKNSRHIYLDKSSKTFKLKEISSNEEYKISLLDKNKIEELANRKRKYEIKKNNSPKRTDQKEQEIQKNSSANGRKAEQLVWDKIKEGNFNIKDEKLIAIDQTYINNTNAGYDILAYKGNVKVKLEVKSNQQKNINFFMTKKEINVANENSDIFYIVLVNFDDQEIKILCWDELKYNITLEPETYSVKLKGK